MEKIYLSESKICEKCQTKSKRFVKINNTFICHNCFLKEKNIRVCRPKKRFYKKSSFSKKIYAINGITQLYKGGCTN